MEAINEAIGNHNDLLEEVQKNGPEFGGLKVAVLSIEGTAQDSVNLRLSGSGDEATDKVVGEVVELKKAETESVAELSLIVSLPGSDVKAEIRLNTLPSPARALTVDATLGSGPTKVSLSLQSLEPKKIRVDRIAAELSNMKTKKNSLRARHAQKRRQHEKDQIREVRREQKEEEEEEAVAESEALIFAMAVGGLAWRARGWALFATTVFLLHYHGDYLAM